MIDKYTDDMGNEITCCNCDVTAREWFEAVLQDSPGGHWMVGSTWYCSDYCYEERTKNEG